MRGINEACRNVARGPRAARQPAQAIGRRAQAPRERAPARASWPIAPSEHDVTVGGGAPPRGPSAAHGPDKAAAPMAAGGGRLRGRNAHFMLGPDLTEIQAAAPWLLSRAIPLSCRASCRAPTPVPAPTTWRMGLTQRWSTGAARGPGDAQRAARGSRVVLASSREQTRGWRYKMDRHRPRYKLGAGLHRGRQGRQWRRQGEGQQEQRPMWQLSETITHLPCLPQRFPDWCHYPLSSPCALIRPTAPERNWQRLFEHLQRDRCCPRHSTRWPLRPDADPYCLSSIRCAVRSLGPPAGTIDLAAACPSKAKNNARGARGAGSLQCTTCPLHKWQACRALGAGNAPQELARLARGPRPETHDVACSAATFSTRGTPSLLMRCPEGGRSSANSGGSAMPLFNHIHTHTLMIDGRPATVARQNPRSLPMLESMMHSF